MGVYPGFKSSYFDPAGAGMPVSVARQIEYWIERYLPEADIKLKPIILTAEQVECYGLPRIPIKESDRRKTSFETTYGTGAVELDALEALYPGEFVRILSEEVCSFRDPELPAKVSEAEAQAREVLEEERAIRLGACQAELEALQGDIVRIVGGYEARLEELNEQLQEELAPYRNRLDSLQQVVQAELERSMEVELPVLPQGEGIDKEDCWLYDSGRSYFEQLATYKQHQNGGAM